MKENIKVQNFLNILITNKCRTYGNMSLILRHLYKLKNKHLSNLLIAYIKLYVDGDYNDILWQSSWMHNIIIEGLSDRKFYYDFIFQTLKLDDLSYLTSYLKDIDKQYNLPDKKYEKIAESFKRNLANINDNLLSYRGKTYPTFKII